MDLFFVEQVLVILSNDMLRSCPQKIAVVPRSGSRTIRDGMLQKVLGGFLSVYKDLKLHKVPQNSVHVLCKLALTCCLSNRQTEPHME